MGVYGKVSLVGAGPGDEELITLKGLKAIEEAEVLVYDRLASPALVMRAPKDCERIDVGKQSADHTLPQEEINDLLVQKGLEGKRVVRLKGGDPYVFGRGGEEGEALHKAGVTFEVVPGITSAIGGLAAAGIPITHREYASSFHVITGHLKDESKDHDWKAIAAYEGTLVFLMGYKNLNYICEQLILNGKPSTTPAAIVQWATTPLQRKCVATLAELPAAAAAEDIGAPCLIVVGEVVSMHQILDFKARLPLAGKTIAVTRGRDQASGLVGQLRALGAQVIETPMIKIEPLESPELKQAILKLQSYTHLIFTSVNGVELFFRNLKANGLDARALSGLTCTVIGSATCDALQQQGITTDHMPKDYVAESLWETLGPVLKSSDRVLIPRAKEARPYLVERIASVCAVEEIPIYEAVPVVDSLLTKDQQQSLDVITFTSSSTVKHFFDSYGEAAKTILSRVKALSIGPITTETLTDYGVSHIVTADTYTIDGLVSALLKEENHA